MQIILVVVCTMIFIWFVRSYYRTQHALQWWSCRQSLKLFLEAEIIRDNLLQEFFTIRRSLELLPVENQGLSFCQTQECLTKTNSFHLSLAQLSDRLFPAYLQDSLPLAIESTIEPWVHSHPHLYFDIEMPKSWRHEPAESSLIVLRTLEELLAITVPEVVTELSINISLKQLENLGQLMVKITYPDVSALSFYSSLPELSYLCETFRFLTSGKTFRQSNSNSVAWYFCWSVPVL
ncbi:hypothetical protein [Brasilonema octagenarum]|nr:hypothetical protein [Brasilonema octagenarum]